MPTKDSGFKARCYTQFVGHEWDQEKAASNIEKHGFLLKKLPPSSTIRFTLIFMTRTIPLKNIDILLWGNRPLGVC